MLRACAREMRPGRIDTQPPRAAMVPTTTIDPATSTRLVMANELSVSTSNATSTNITARRMAMLMTRNTMPVW